MCVWNDFLVLIFFRGVTGGRGGWGDLTSLSFFTIIIAPLSYRHCFCSGKSISPPESRSKWFSRGDGIGSPFNVGWVTADERLKVRWRPL